MTVSELIHPGDKIEIRMIHQMEHDGKMESTMQIYKSKVLDIKKNGNLEIAMPTEGSKLVLLPLDIRFEFVFFSGTVLYKSIGLVKERYKKDNLYMLEIELKAQLEKYQRREYYRYACTLDFSFYMLSKEQAALETVDAIFESLCDDKYVFEERRGTVVDLSGGGMKFRSEYDLEKGQSILVGLRLVNEHMDKQYYILGNIIACEQLENVKGRLYMSRVKFMIKDNKIREEIIRYIFEEERRIRRKANG